MPSPRLIRQPRRGALLVAQEPAHEDHAGLERHCPHLDARHAPLKTDADSEPDPDLLVQQDMQQPIGVPHVSVVHAGRPVFVVSRVGSLRSRSVAPKASAAATATRGKNSGVYVIPTSSFAPFSIAKTRWLGRSPPPTGIALSTCSRSPTRSAGEQVVPGASAASAGARSRADRAASLLGPCTCRQAGPQGRSPAAAQR